MHIRSDMHSIFFQIFCHVWKWKIRFNFFPHIHCCSINSSLTLINPTSIYEKNLSPSSKASTSRVAIVFDVRPNVGAKVAQQFTTDGYKVAAVSRSNKGLDAGNVALSIKANLTDLKTVHAVFEEVRSELGEPIVVVYNSMRLSCTLSWEYLNSRLWFCWRFALLLLPAVAYSASQRDFLFVDLSAFQDHLAVNISSTFAAI